MKLLIVESPAKAKTLSRYLGKDYKVLSSYGHVRSLPSEKDAVQPENDFSITYKILSKSSKVIKSLQDSFKEADKVYLATDPDREGEAIAWHITESMKEKKSLSKDLIVERVEFQSITKEAVLKGIANPRKLDDHLVHAQQARQALDYLVGFTLSPVLWRKLPGSRSAGRVQSVALKILCDRENEIDDFIKEEYWSIEAIFLTSDKKDFAAKLNVYNQDKLDKMSVKTEEEAANIVKQIQDLDYAIQGITKKEVKKNPPAPFTTSTLIQEGVRKFGFSAKKTMSVAQTLYEGVSIDGSLIGLITYMRTDSVTLSDGAVSDIRSYIKSTYGNQYLSEKPIVYKTKSKVAQEAHEAIRPNTVDKNPESIKNFLTDEQYKLYSLIWKRTVACQMSKAVYQSTSIEITSKDQKHMFKASGSILVFEGFQKLYKETKDSEEQLLPNMSEGMNVTLDDLKHCQHFTQPPPRYTEASLVKRMEELGIGRPSTYPIIISILVDRDYAKIEQKRFVPESRGRLVDTFLSKFFPKYIDYEFTANLEDELDGVADGKKEWKAVLSNFWYPFKEKSEEVLGIKNMEILENIEKSLEKHIFKAEENKNSKKCTKCNDGTLGLRTSKFGAFIGCSNYPKCDYRRSLFSDDADGDTQEVQDNILGIDPTDNKEIFLKKGPYGFYLEKIIDNKPKRVSLLKSAKTPEISLELASNLMSLPKKLGKHPDNNEEVFVKIGRYGPYLECNKKFYSLKTLDKIDIDLDEAIEIIAKGKK